MNACVIVRACSCALLCMQLLRTAACYLGSAVTWPLLRNTRGGSSAEGNDHISHSQDFLNFSTCTWGTVSVGALLQILFKGEMLLAVLRVTAVINQVKKKKSSMQPQCFFWVFFIFHTLLQDFRSLQLKLLQMYHPTPTRSHEDSDNPHPHQCFVLGICLPHPARK